MTGVSFEIPNLQRLVAKLEAVAPVAGNEALAKALYEEATLIFNESQVQVPVKFGVLKSSGNVSLPKIEGPTVEVTVGYGGAASAYALFVHEITENHHAAPTKAKFLEDPAVAAMPLAGVRISASVARALETLRA